MYIPSAPPFFYELSVRRTTFERGSIILIVSSQTRGICIKISRCKKDVEPRFKRDVTNDLIYILKYVEQTVHFYNI